MEAVEAGSAVIRGQCRDQVLHIPPVLREELLAVEEDRIHGSKGYSVDEAAAMMRDAIRETAGRGTSE